MTGSAAARGAGKRGHRLQAPGSCSGPPGQLDELDPFNQMLAVIETRAHLELLAAQGRLASSSADGVTFYQAAGPTG
jgi:hypothetical protein